MGFSIISLLPGSGACCPRYSKNDISALYVFLVIAQSRAHDERLSTTRELCKFLGDSAIRHVSCVHVCFSVDKSERTVKQI